MYEYKMIQIPPTISIQEKSHRGNEAAAYLEKVVNDMARKGWEFSRVDPVGVNVQPGCLGILSGSQTTQAIYYVVTFRKESR